MNVFSMLFPVFYIAAFYFDLALFRYYPEARQFHWARTDGIGVVILWYGWIVTAALASAAVAVAVAAKFKCAEAGPPLCRFDRRPADFRALG